jgi:putative ABC transport system substrate-binding protein
MRRIGVLINVVADEQDSLGRLSAFRQALQQLGWSDGGNVRIEARVAKGNPERLRSDSA